MERCESRGTRSMHGRVSVVALLLTLLVGAAAFAQPTDEAADAGDTGGGREPVTMTIMDDDAVMLIAKVDGRDVVRVVGRTRVEHGSRTIWTSELEYDEEAGHAEMEGDVQLVDDSDDGLNLTARALRLDLNTEAATASGEVRFERGDAQGAADELHYGEYEEVQAVIEAQLAARTDAVRRMVNDTLAGFLADDKVLVLIGRVDMKDGEREFQSEFVIVNTRDDAMVSLGRSSARLPGPDGGDD